MNYDELRSVLAVRDDLERGSGAAPEDVLRAAGLLGELPEDYRRFLVEFGWIAVGSFEIFGLGDDVPDYLNVVTVTLSERAEAGLPDQLIALMNDGGGNLSCLDVHARDAHELMPVVYWDHELRASAIPPRRLADSFSDWLKSLISA